jgi:hypothetical protein
MRYIAIGLLVIGFGIQGCGAPPENSIPSDPSSNAADTSTDTSTATNAAGPADAQSNSSTEGNNASAGGAARPCGPPTLTSCLDGVAPPPPINTPPVAVNATPQRR